jgi:hypothetical protein
MRGLSIVCLFVSIIWLQSCASFTGFQDAKAIGDKNWDLSLSVNRGITPSFDDDSSVGSESDYATVEIGSRYGLSNKVDLSLKINTNFNVAFGTKYQIKGDLLSKNAFAIGLEVGSFTVITPLLNVQLPLYYSHHFNNKWTWNFSPRYVAQFNIDNVRYDSAIHYLGGNTGFLYGSKHKIGIDFGLYRASVTEYGVTRNSFINSIGIAGRFMFLDNKEDSGKEKKSRRPKRKREN